jgi:hypothetical protein
MSIISVLVIAILSACGPAPTPTLSVADLQGTAIANAWLAMTMTQLAMPTATQTPIPPTPTATFTPPPTFTPFPTLAPATLAGTAAPDPCDGPPPIAPKGALVKIQFVNKSNSSLNLSFAMAQENSLKECGTYSFTLGKFDQPEVQVLAGCYWGWAWVLDPPSNAKTPKALCITDTSKTTSVWITNELISRQNLILDKLLSAEKSEIERDFEDKRESKTGVDVPRSKTEGYFEYKNATKNDQELIQRNSYRLNSFYDKKYNSYIKNLQNIK